MAKEENRRNFTIKTIKPASIVGAWWISLVLCLLLGVDRWPFSYFPMFTQAEDSLPIKGIARCGDVVKKEVNFNTRFHRSLIRMYFLKKDRNLISYLSLRFCEKNLRDCQIELSYGAPDFSPILKKSGHELCT